MSTGYVSDLLASVDEKTVDTKQDVGKEDGSYCIRMLVSRERRQK